jgi:protein ImuB
MLWIAIDFPLLPLESYPQISARSEPWAIAEGGKVAICNTYAAALGVRHSMKLSAACALAPNLNHQARDLKVEAAALEHIAVWAGQFSPSVSLQRPTGIVLEIEGSLSLLGGINSILAAVKRGTTEMGYTALVACAPTVSAAWILARAGVTKIVASKRLIETEISKLPITALDCSDQTLETLAAIGMKSIGDLLRLPRDGLTRRTGAYLLQQLDRALGALPEARQFYTPPPGFSATLELGSDVSDSAALTFAAKRLITQLVGYLAGRYAAIQHFELILMSETSQVALTIGLATPSRQADRLLRLTRERLAALRLTAPICRIALKADEILKHEERSGQLFADALDTTEDWAQLVERMRAKLGDHAVQGLAARAVHRPECAWEAVMPGTKIPARAPKPTRPLWLLDQPRALKEADSKPHYNESPLSFIAGPERIESGWWDERDIKRDYFVALTAEHSTLWIYRERREPGGWFLHGIFG